MVREIPRATIVGNLQFIGKKYPHFLDTIESQSHVPGMGRVIADIKPSQTDEFNHRVMAIPLVVGMIFKLARGNAEILGYDLDVSRAQSGDDDKIFRLDALLRVQPRHGATRNLKPGFHVVKVRHADVFNKRLVLIDSQSDEDKEVIEFLRNNGFKISGHIVVRSGPRFANSHTLNVTDQDDLRVWEVNMRLDFDEVAEESRAVATTEVDSAIIDQLQQGTKESIETILNTAGAWQPVTKKSWFATLGGLVRIAVQRLTVSRKSKRSALPDTKSVSIGKLDRQLKRFIPGRDPQAVYERDEYIDATNRWNRKWFYESLVESKDLQGACKAFEERLATESNNITDGFISGKVSKRGASKLVKYLDRESILETIKTRVQEIEKEIMRNYFELRETPAWQQHKRTLNRTRWFAHKLGRRIEKIRKATQQRQENGTSENQSGGQPEGQIGRFK